MNLQLFVILLQIPLRKIVFKKTKDSSYNSSTTTAGACIEPGESTVKVLYGIRR
jgi:hypothetical protein